MVTPRYRPAMHLPNLVQHYRHDQDPPLINPANRPSIGPVPKIWPSGTKQDMSAHRFKLTFPPLLPLCTKSSPRRLVSLSPVSYFERLTHIKSLNNVLRPACTH